MRFCFPAILFASMGFAATSEWTGTTNSDLETSGNWSAGVPTSADTANFDGATATSLTPTLSTTSAADFQCQAFNFESSSNTFSFTIHGPYSLDFYGDGITGSSSDQTIQTAYPGTMISLQQILFSQGTPIRNRGRFYGSKGWAPTHLQTDS